MCCDDINTQWKGISIRDKVVGTREIPATPYTLHLMTALPRRNEWVFSSPTSASGCLTEPNTPHTRACRAAGLDGLTLHGLRRSFKSLTEWLEVPVYLSKQGPVLVLLLCGGDKSDQNRNIERAIAYLKDWKQRGKP